MSKAALYIRVSTTYQVDKDSLPLQRQELINYASYALNINDYEVFEDAGYSGKNTDRPAYQDMMSRVRAGEFSHIMVYKIDRISRNLLDFATMYTEMKDLGIIFVSKNEQFDTSSAMGEAMLKIILVFAELERNMTSERVTAVMISRAEKGLWNGANVPLGYQWSDEKQFPVVDEAEAHTVRLIYNMYEELRSAYRVVKYLNQNNVQTKRNGSWTSKTVGDILHNPFYKGTLRYNYRQSGRGKKKDASEWILKENNHVGIVSPEQWQRCNDLLACNFSLKNKTGSLQRRKFDHVFSSLLRCKCGGGTIAGLDRPRVDGWQPSRYRCNNLNRGLGCTSRHVMTDVILGPFIFNYINNLLQIQSNISRIRNVAEMEKHLLHGDAFKDVVGINGLNHIYTILKGNIQPANYEIKVKSSPALKLEDESLFAEKSKIERALERLKKLYLFDDESMSEKEYITEKSRLSNSLVDLEKKIQSCGTPRYDEITFLSNAANFVMLQKLSAQKYINYRELSSNTETIVLKEFIRSVVAVIRFEDRQITSIEFKNGMIHNFIYKET